MDKIAKFIVKFRLIFVLVFIAGAVVSSLFISKVNVENDISAFLPSDSETAQALLIMEDDFETVGMWTLTLKNVDEEHALEVQKELSQVENVSYVNYDDVDGFKDGYAKMTIILDKEITSEQKAVATSDVKAILDDEEVLSVALYGEYDDMLSEISLVLVISVFVIILVLLLTSKSFVEIPIFLVVFALAAVLNMGTNAILPSVSFITDSIAVIMQLALAIDYAIILGHTYMHERESLPPKEAMEKALAKAIREILSSSLTTISGLVALMFMQMSIGLDLGIVLSKGIIFSFLVVCCVMPGLMLLFDKGIQKTKHRSFMPSVKKPARAIQKASVPIACIFGILVVGGTIIQANNVFTFGDNGEYNQAIYDEVNGVFGETNSIGIILEKDKYEEQKAIIEVVKKHSEVATITGIAGMEFVGVNLVDALTKDEVTQIAVENKDVLGMSEMEVRLIITVLYSSAGVDGYDAVPLIEVLEKALASGGLDNYLSYIPDEYTFLLDSLGLVSGEKYTRILIDVKLPLESEETFAYIDMLREEVRAIDSEVLLFGDVISRKDLSDTFDADLLLISLMTALFVFIILVVAFRGFGLPLILIATIQGSIFLNFSIPVIFGDSVFFLSYIIMTAIQMGATIDYAIVITNRYKQERINNPDKKEAMVNAVNASFPSVLTSGLIMTVAGFLVGTIPKNAIISSIGMYLGQGTLISLIMVLFVLPQLIVLFDKFINATSLKSGKMKIATEGVTSSDLVQETIKEDISNGEEFLSDDNSKIET